MSPKIKSISTGTDELNLKTHNVIFDFLNAGSIELTVENQLSMSFITYKLLVSLTSDLVVVPIMSIGRAKIGLCNKSILAHIYYVF